NRSLRLFSRAGRVSIPRRWSRSSVSVKRAPRGTAIRSRSVRGESGTSALLGGHRYVDALDVEREADGRQRPPEAGKQLVVAPAAAQRHAVGRVVHLENRAGVVVETVNQPEVEDHARRDAR